MGTSLKTVFFVIITCTLAITSGCDTRYTKPTVEFFHEGQPSFRPGPPGGAESVAVTSGVDFAKYKMIILDPVIFKFGSAAQYNAIPQNVITDLRKDFRKAFADALGNAYPLVDQPSPNAMRLRVLIDGIVPSVPDASTTDRQTQYISVGGASMKAEFLDAWTNKRVAAVMDTKTGDQLPAVKSTDQWVHVRGAFKFWAQRLRVWLDETHGRT
jgi:hypothetical protein